MKTYEDWTKTLHSTKDEQYWDNLVLYSTNIVHDLDNMKAYKVAEKLNIQPNVLSYIKPIIIAVSKVTK